MSLVIIGFLSIMGTYFLSDKVKFDINKIKYSNVSIELYDNNNRPIKDASYGTSFVKLNTLNNYTINAFISIEDKDFYNHNGLNYKRMVKAMLKNISSFKIKEGASTISQQLIKNTHLTNEKTFTRKINEIALTRQLEKTMTKDEIMEYYLNIIYFGDNCYGIENASKHYFSKSAKDLSLSESASLAGMIKSPNSYSPIKNVEKTTTRRNLVLSEMLKDEKISFEDYAQATMEKLTTNVSQINSNSLNSYSSACIDEACDILRMPAKQIAIGEYKIYTYFDKDKQNALQNSLSSYNNQSDYAGISIKNNSGAIEAYYAKSNVKLIFAKRQPGSAIKPVLVYAPALNENIISPLTQINDEKININGYTPSNVNDKFYGYVSVRECVSKSLNIPAVKVLGYVGINKAKSYANRCGIEFDENDKNLGIALGGMTYGTSLKELTGAYSIFPSLGKYTEPKFINYITDKNGKIIYRNQPVTVNVLREDSAYLMTDMLKSCAKEGTARKLGNLPFDVASKTGTVGQSYNTDAWNISYTNNDVVGVWFGNADNSKIDTVGGGIPTDVVKNYMQKIYETNKPSNFVVPTSIYTEDIDSLSLSEEHIVYRANNYIPERYIIKDVFSRFNPPKSKSTKFISCSPPTLVGKVEDNVATLEFEAQDYLIYELYKIEDDKEQLISVIANKKGKCSQSFNISGKTKFFIITKIKNYADNTEIISDKSNIIELIPTNLDNTVKIKWYG